MHVVSLEAITRLVKASREIISNDSSAVGPSHTACIHQSIGGFIEIILRKVLASETISRRWSYLAVFVLLLMLTNLG